MAAYYVFENMPEPLPVRIEKVGYWNFSMLALVPSLGAFLPQTGVGIVQIISKLVKQNNPITSKCNNVITYL